jgi:hypothetical protein
VLSLGPSAGANRRAASAAPAAIPSARPAVLMAQAGDDQGPTGIYGVDSDDQTETVPPPDSGRETLSTTATTHTVRRGDTLWDISRPYFHDPWRWPKVWALNPEIANPHWIFPGQLVRLRDTTAAPPPVAAGGDAAPGWGASRPEALAASLSPSGPQQDPRGGDSPELRQLGFVDEQSLKAAGVINGSLEEKMMLATGDHAYVEFPGNQPPKGGTRYSVYQVDTEHPLKEPKSDLVLGYLVHLYGEVVIDSLTDRPTANARLEGLSEPVERGYRVGPVFHQLRSVKPRANVADMTARIVAAVEPNLLIANQMFVVLNRGRRHGVEVGNRFLVLRQGDGIKRLMEDWDANDHRFPPHAVAEIVAVDVQNETTVGWISRGTRELHKGDVADLRRGY